MQGAQVVRNGGELLRRGSLPALFDHQGRANSSNTSYLSEPERATLTRYGGGSHASPGVAVVTYQARSPSAASDGIATE
jgi:hypothetical protein